jgi:hypothetical protein
MILGTIIQLDVASGAILTIGKNYSVDDDFVGAFRHLLKLGYEVKHGEPWISCLVHGINLNMNTP